MIKDWILSFYNRNFQVIKLWFFYILIIHLVPIILSLLGLTKELPFNFKTYLIDFWGYYWDGAHYLKITQVGYSYPLQAFFPGYPLLLRILDLFLPFTIIYKINILLSLPLLIQFKELLKKLKFDDRNALFSLIAFLCFPTSFFLQANYTETLYILLSAWGLNLLLENKITKASLVGFLLSFVKITSVVFTFTLFIKLLKDYKDKLLISKKIVNSLLLVTFTTLGIFLYFGYLQQNFKSYSIYFKAQGEWGRGTQEIPFISEFKDVKKKFIFQKTTELIVFVFGIFLLIYSYKKIPIELYLFSLFHFLIPLSTGTFLSINRLFLLSFPIILWFFASLYTNKRVYWLFVTSMLVLQLIGINLFIKGHFIG